MSVPVVPLRFCKARRVIEHDLARTTVPSPTGEARYSRHRLTFTPGTAVAKFHDERDILVRSTETGQAISSFNDLQLTYKLT